MCDGVQVQREAGRGGVGLHLSAVIFKEVKRGCSKLHRWGLVRVWEWERSSRVQYRTF